MEDEERASILPNPLKNEENSKHFCLQLIFVFSLFSPKLKLFPFPTHTFHPHSHPGCPSHKPGSLLHTRCVVSPNHPTPRLCLGCPQTLQLSVILLHPGVMGTSVHITNFADFPSDSPSHSLWASSSCGPLKEPCLSLSDQDSHFFKITT